MNEVRLTHILDTYEYQIVTPFNPQWSQNVSHNYDNDTFTVDCCYDILQHLLRICMPTISSVQLQGTLHPKLSTFLNNLRLIDYKENISVRSCEICR
jgi:hypothetical protein